MFRYFKLLGKRNQIISLSVIGFFLTGILGYPYSTFWDASRVMSYILVDGHANIDNWQGWYFPLLWEYLYKITGIINIMGTYIILLYWIGVTSLYLNIFDYQSKSVWWFVGFAFFPGTLLFILNITNNALMMVMLILAIVSYVKYVQKRNYLWIFLSLAFLIQCYFIRRESFVIVLPLLFCMLFVELISKYKKLKSLIIAGVMSFLLFGIVIFTEKAVTDRIPNYKYMDALTLTCLQDMAAVTFLENRMCIPTHIFKNEYANGQACFEKITTMVGANDSILSGDKMYHTIAPYAQIDDIYKLKLPLSDIIFFYTHHFSRYVQYRLYYGLQFMKEIRTMCMRSVYDGKMILYEVPQPTAVQFGLSVLVPQIIGGLRVFLIFAFLILFFDYKGWVKYDSIYDRLMTRALIFTFFVDILLVALTSIGAQYRYLYPVNVVIYLLFIYILSKLNYNVIGEKLIYYSKK